MKSTPLKHKRRRLNRFFVSDYFRASSVSSVQMRSMLQVSIASSSAITSGLLSFGRDRFISFEPPPPPCLNRFFVSDYFRARSGADCLVILEDVSIASSSAITSGLFHGWRGCGVRQRSQSLLRERLLPGANKGESKVLAVTGLNRFFVSDYFRAVREIPYVEVNRRRLNRFFVSDYFRAEELCIRLNGCSMSQSHLRQRLLPGQSSSISRSRSQKFSIASSSAITSGRCRLPLAHSRGAPSQSLLRQRLLPGELQAVATKLGCFLRLNRFFVSDYFRAAC